MTLLIRGVTAFAQFPIPWCWPLAAPAPFVNRPSGPSPARQYANPRDLVRLQRAIVAAGACRLASTDKRPIRFDLNEFDSLQQGDSCGALIQGELTGASPESAREPDLIGVDLARQAGSSDHGGLSRSPQPARWRG